MAEEISRRGAGAPRMLRHTGLAFSAPLRVYVCIALMSTLVTAAGCTSSAPATAVAAQTTSKSPSDEPPLIGITGGRLPTPSGDEKMKAMALIFVLADCPICNAYVPELNRLHEAFAPRGIGLFVVHVDPDIGAQRASAHAKEYGLLPLVAIDSRHQWVKRAGATIAPQAAVFSPSGELLYRGRINDQYAGLGKRRANVTSHDLREALDAILAGQPVREPRTEAIGCPIPELPQGE